MNANKRIARIVGTLFIIGTAAGILSAGFTGSILTASDYLIEFSASESQVTIGALLVLIMGFALALIPVTMFPILKTYNEALALGYVVFRGALETAAYISIAISWLLLLTFSQEYVNAGTLDASYFQSVGALIQAAGHWISYHLSIVFSLGALIFYYLLYRSKLIPRWLSAWGLVAAILYLASALLGIFALIPPMSPIQIVMNLPMAVQEMVLAVWLIAKGFNASVLMSEPVKTD